VGDGRSVRVSEGEAAHLACASRRGEGDVGLYGPNRQAR
jgi:hypothetical protein